MKKTLLLLVLLAGCNQDGSFHVPFTGTDTTMSPAQRANLEQAYSICDQSYGHAQDQCIEQIQKSGPGTGDLQHFGVFLGPGGDDGYVSGYVGP